MWGLRPSAVHGNGTPRSAPGKLSFIRAPYFCRRYPHYWRSAEAAGQGKIIRMHCARSILALCFLGTLAVLPSFAASEEPVDTPVISCGNGVPGGINCIPSKRDIKEARNAYSRGLKFEGRSHLDQAFLA